MLIDHEQIHRPEPQIELDMCPVKNVAAGRGVLLAAGFAAVKAAGSDHTELISAAVWADKTMRKAQPEEKLAAALLGIVFLRKINDAEFRLWEY